MADHATVIDAARRMVCYRARQLPCRSISHNPEDWCVCCMAHELAERLTADHATGDDRRGPQEKDMEYEVARSRGTVDEWRVEAIDHEGDGDCYVTLFCGPQSKARAEEYAAWKNGLDTALATAEAGDGALARLEAKWREEADGVEATGYSQQADRMRACADDLAAIRRGSSE